MTSKRSVLVSVVGPLALAAALAGCGGGEAKPTVVITSDNAPVAAAEVLLDGDQIGNVTDVGMPMIAESTRGPGHARIRPLDSTPCTVSGSLTVSSAVTNSGGGSQIIAYDHCIDTIGSFIDGSLSIAISDSGASTTATVTVDLTTASQPVSSTETGNYTLVFTSSASSASYQLTSDNLEVAISDSTVIGVPSDDIKLSDVNVTISEQIATGSDDEDTFSVTESYSVNSTQLKGNYSVDTVTPLAVGEPDVYPHAGRVDITGANGSSLTITILGDDTFTPPTGQGQVELQVGSDTPVYLSWAQISAAGGV